MILFVVVMVKHMAMRAKQNAEVLLNTLRENVNKIMRRLILILFFITNIVLAQTTIVNSFNYGGINRSYRLYIPAAYNGSVPVPLILNLHGFGSNALEQQLYSFFMPIADTANFLMVYPEGTTDAFGNQNWNSLGLSNVDDVGFLSALIDTLSVNYSLDLNCVYSTGMSNGGFMSYKLACNLGNKIAAIASVTGTMIWNEFNNCSPSHPTPVMQIHGTADNVVPYNGSFILVPVDTLVKSWAQKNNCDPIPVITMVPDIDPNDGCTAENYLFTNGDQGSTVELYKVISGAHTWPGAPVDIDVTNHDFSASVEIWRFFRSYKLNILTGIDFKPHIENTFIVYPNPAENIFNINFNNKANRIIKVYNNLGINIIELEHNDNNLNLKIEKAGIYILKIQEGSSYFSKKLIIN